MGFLDTVSTSVDMLDASTRAYSAQLRRDRLEPQRSNMMRIWVCGSRFGQSLGELSLWMEACVEKGAPGGGHGDRQLMLLLEVIDELLQGQVALDLEAVPERPGGLAVLRNDKRGTESVKTIFPSCAYDDPVSPSAL